MNNPTDIFDFKLLNTFPGYNSAGDKTSLKPGTLIRGSKNVYKKLTGTIASRPGIKRRGTLDTTNAGVNSSFEWNTSVGTERPLRVCNGKLQVESNIADGVNLVWYDLFETSTLNSPAATYSRFVFDTWWDNDEKTDRLIMVRGDDNILHWSGGIALIDSVTSTTITKQGSETWAELGFATQISGEKKIIIGGIEYTYTGGESTTTLTGVTASSGDPSTNGVASGDVAIQSVMVSATVPVANYKADFIKVIGNQAWVGSYSSKVVWISADATAGGTLGFLKFTQSGTLVTGDPDAIVLDNLAKGIGVQDNYVIIFAGDSDMMVVVPNDPLPITQAATLLSGGTERAVIQRIEKKRLGALSSCLGHEFIDNLGGNLIWLDQKNRLRALGTFANVDSIKPVSLSVAVQNELTEDDFIGGHIKVITDNDGDTVYITAPNNARDWMYQIRETVNESGQVITERLWQPPQIRGISRFAVISGAIYGHSNVNPQIYQIWDTEQWFDDGASNEEIPYTCVARFAYQQHGRRQGREFFDMIYFEGYMLQGTELLCNVYYDYQGASGTRAVTISNDTDLATFFTGINPSSLGDSSLGDNPLGDGIIEEANSQNTVPKFRAITNISNPKNFFEYSLEVYSLNVDARWELLVLGANVKLAPENATFLRK